MTPSLRLDRLLANLGYGSRKEVRGMLRRGEVQHENVILDDYDMPVSDEMARNILVKNEPLDPTSPLTILLHKPAGYTCSKNDAGPIVYDLLPARFCQRTPALEIAGRLDKDSTGLVLLSDNGMMVHQITAPRTHLDKEYHVTLSDTLKGNEAQIFASGTLMLRGEKTPLKPAELIVIDEKSSTVILHEGRYHQIKRMFAATGNKVETLHRVRIGDYNLENLEEGQYRII